MYNLYRLIIKNFKLLIRSKTSALIVIFGPLLVIFLAGIAFDNTNTYSIKIGVYSSSYSSDAESFIEKLNQQEFKVIKTSSEDNCINEIKKGKLHTCIIFPPGLDIQDVEKQSEVVFYVDYSKINLVYMVMDTLSEKLEARSSEISKDLTNVILKRLEDTRVEIFNKNPVLANLKKTSSSQKKEAVSIKSELEALDLSFDPDSFNISAMGSNAQSIKIRNDELEIYVISRLDSSIGNLSVAQDAEGSLGNASSSTLDNALDELDELLNKSKGKAVSINNLTERDVNTLISLISNANIELNNVKSKINAASAARTKASNQANSIQSSMEDTMGWLNDIQTSLNNIDKNLASIPVTSAERIVSPITTKIKPISAERTHLNYVFPSLIVLVIMFISILLSCTLVMMEKHSPAYFRNFMTPVKNLTFIFSSYITTLLLVLVQLLIILGISSYFFESQILGNFLNISLMMLLISTTFILLGMLIGYMFTSEETGTLASISVGSIFLFVSDLILPLESMPLYVQDIANYNPFVIGQNLLRKTIIFSSKLQPLANDIYLLLAYTVVVFFIIYIYFKLSKKNILTKFIYKRQKRRAEKQKENKNKQKRLKKKTNNIVKSKKPSVSKKDKKRSFFFGEIYVSKKQKDEGKGFFKYLKRKKDNINKQK